MKLRKFVITALLSGLMLCLSGCLFQSVDELYSLPRLPDDYYNLQSCLDEVLVNGAEYAAPVSGSQQQPVQLVDLDGDGVKEAVAFVKTSGEKPLKVYIFRKIDGAYSSAAVIEGEGSAFQSVEYTQLDEDEALELIVCRQVSDQVPQAVGVYDLSEDYGVTELMSTTFTEYQTADLDNDGRGELLLLCDSGDAAGTAQVYSWQDGLLEKTGESQMSVAVSAVRRIVVGALEDGTQAVFVASDYDESSLVTDVFALRDGQLVNVTAEIWSEGGVQTIRNYYVYATDVDSDGVLELPSPIPLPSTSSESSESYWIIQWYSLSVDGTVKNKTLTYHNYSAGWYLELPNAWKDKLTVYREDAAYVFAAWRGADSAPTPLFSIGSAAKDEVPEGSTALAEQNGTVYYLTLAEDIPTDWQQELTADNLSARFHIIQTDWYTGEM